MAEKRMFAKTIVLSDAFLDMSLGARCLYFTLSMVADDDGFVNNPRSIMRQCGASDDEMKELIKERFILIFDSGVIVIKHWRINNYLRSDRYTETKYKTEKEKLSITDNGAYTEKEFGIPGGIPSIDKISIDKNSICDTHPSIDEIKEYCSSINSTIDPDKFYAYYESTGWISGKNTPVTNWKAKIDMWEINEKTKTNSKFKNTRLPDGVGRIIDESIMDDGDAIYRS